MAVNNFTQVVFNDGEPVDIDKFNQMNANTVEVWKASTNLATALKNGKKGNAVIPVVDGGYVSTPAWTPKSGGWVKTETLGFSVNFSGKPIVVATVAGKTTYPVTLQVSESAGSYSINAYSTGAQAAVLINWIAFEQKEISI